MNDQDFELFKRVEKDLSMIAASLEVLPPFEEWVANNRELKAALYRIAEALETR